MKKLSTDEFVAKAKIIHGDKYDYSKVQYKNSETKVEIKCKTHGIFEQKPHIHLLGCNCPRCADHFVIQKMTSATRCTKEKFIQKAIAAHGDKYNYDFVEYKNNRTKVCVICPEHGMFYQTPGDHIVGKGCKKCSVINTHNKQRSTTQEFTDRAQAKYGNRYDYSNVIYTNNSTPVNIICPKHGQFHQSPSSHLKSQYGCDKCADELSALKRTGDKNPHWNSNREYINLRKKINTLCKNLLRCSLNKTGQTKTDWTNEMLGYKRRDLYQHITLHPNWASVKNGKWHADHIFPIKAFVEHNIIDPKVINALDNIQPVSEQYNLKKGDHYDKKKFIEYLVKKYGKDQCFNWAISI